VFFFDVPCRPRDGSPRDQTLGRSAIVISIIAFFIPLLSDTFASLLFGLTTVQSLFMGLLLSITAVPVSAIVLMLLRKLKPYLIFQQG
jgi:Kef-type K+ transport system membrane component KefB